VLGALLASAFSRHAVLSASVINGGLGGLVAITAGAATMDPALALITGLVGGMLAVKGNDLLLFLGLDDVVGAVAVHGFAGAWGTLAAGLFHHDGLFDLDRAVVQLTGIAAAFLWGFGASWLLFRGLDAISSLRTSSINEQRGLDFTEHGELGYGEFQQVMTHAEARP
jgi:Amt family ammonium transporter